MRIDRISHRTWKSNDRKYITDILEKGYDIKDTFYLDLMKTAALFDTDNKDKATPDEIFILLKAGADLGNNEGWNGRDSIDVFNVSNFTGIVGHELYVIK